MRSQDILPLLVKRFDFDLFVAYASIVDAFVSRAFGHNFDADAAWDKAFIDRVHACDEVEIAAGRVKPTHMLAVLTHARAGAHRYAGKMTPQFAIRRPD